jgi:hypothetical protein
MSDTPKITQVFVKVKREVDLGFVPFMDVARHYMKKKQQIPFGMRDASRASFEISLTAEVGDANIDDLVADLSERAHAITDRELRAEFPEIFKEAAKAELPEDAFTVASTTVERTVAGDF